LTPCYSFVVGFDLTTLLMTMFKNTLIKFFTPYSLFCLKKFFFPPKKHLTPNFRHLFTGMLSFVHMYGTTLGAFTASQHIMTTFVRHNKTNFNHKTNCVLNGIKYLSKNYVRTQGNIHRGTFCICWESTL
jgi:hypothetical protein